MDKNEDEQMFEAFQLKMKDAQLPEIAIANFASHYQQLLQGSRGEIAEHDIEAVGKIPDADSLSVKYQDIGQANLNSTVLIKLNGGLGTSMGLDRAKSLIQVRDRLSFLDIIAKHAIHSDVPLLLMNSVNTRDDSIEALKHYSSLAKAGLALDFLQHKVPKVTQSDLSPASHSTDPQLEWCPPGHGDIYIALQTSGILESLLNSNYRYALISNSDNLGATLDTSLLGYMIDEKIPFLMEVTDRSEADKKGGHLAKRADGQFVLRESAQCPQEDKLSFEDIHKHRFFNTNNLWIDLQALKINLYENNNIVDLPLIRNSKTLDPRDSQSAAVYQLETAMGAAIQIFSDARAICVSRRRFAPVKTTNDLLLLRSDVYELQENYTLVSQLAHTEMPLIELDSTYYKLIDHFEQRFPNGSPSLLGCSRLRVQGDVVFGTNVVIKGNVSLCNASSKQASIADNSLIEKDILWE